MESLKVNMVVTEGLSALRLISGTPSSTALKMSRRLADLTSTNEQGSCVFLSEISIVSIST
jgi:hypothetical protein